MMLMQQMEKESVDEQPFFKPSQTQGSQQNFFLFNSESSQDLSDSSVASMFQDTSEHCNASKQHVQNIQSTTYHTPQQRQQQQSTHRIQYQPREREATASSLKGNERLSSLHSKLHQEADKIRRWKTQTEILLKQKEKSLFDTLQTVESQRQSLLELQLQNENLSVRLQEEIGSRVDINEKIESTRNMCALVKDFSMKLEDRFALCEQDQDELHIEKNKHIEDLMKIEKDFQQLSLTHANKISELKTEVEDEKSKQSKLKEEFDEKIGKAENQIRHLKGENSVKDGDLEKLSNTIQERHNHIEKLTHEIECTEKNLHESEAQLNQCKRHLVEARQELDTLKDIHEQTTKDKLQLQTDINALNQQQHDLHKNISLLQENLQKIESERSESSAEYSAVKVQLTAKEKELQGRLEELAELKECTSSERAKLKQQVNELEVESQTLKKTLSSSELGFKSVIEEKEQLLHSIEDHMHALQKKETEISTLKDDLKAVLEREKASYDKLDNLKRDIELESSEKEQLMKVLQDAQMEREILNKDLDETKQHVEELKENVQEMTKAMKSEQQNVKNEVQANVELEKEVNAMKLANKELGVHVEEKLQQEKGTKECLEAELSSKDTKLNILEDKFKGLQGQVGKKTMQVKDLQQENKNLKSKNTQLGKQIAKLTSEVATLGDKLEEKAKEQQQLNDEMDTVKKELNERLDTVTALEKKANNLTSKTEKAVKEHDEAKLACEHQMAEVSATLDKYKAENQKIVTQKDKEIKLLRSKLDNQKKTQKTEADTVSQLENEMVQLKEEISSVTEDNKSLEDELKEKDSDMKTLHDRLKKKEKETEKLRKEMEKSKKKEKKSPQTASPVPMETSFMLQPSTPKKKAVVAANTCRTPRTPLSVKLVTPGNRTPQQGILKPMRSLSAKKRSRVMFASDEDNGTDSDSSTSQLMEIEVGDISVPRPKLQENDKPRQTVTSLRVRPSPHVQRSLSPVPTEETNKRKPLKPVPRGPPVSKQRKNQLLKMPPTPDLNTRKTPRKAFRVKGWGDSPMGKKKVSAKSQKQQVEKEASWFENDAVFGFFE